MAQTSERQGLCLAGQFQVKRHRRAKAAREERLTQKRRRNDSGAMRTTREMRSSEKVIPSKKLSFTCSPRFPVTELRSPADY